MSIIDNIKNIFDKNNNENNDSVLEIRKKIIPCYAKMINLRPTINFTAIKPKYTIFGYDIHYKNNDVSYIVVHGFHTNTDPKTHVLCIGKGKNLDILRKPINDDKLKMFENSYLQIYNFGGYMLHSDFAYFLNHDIKTDDTKVLDYINSYVSFAKYGEESRSHYNVWPHPNSKEFQEIYNKFKQEL